MSNQIQQKSWLSSFPPSDWVETTLGEVCEIKHGFAFKGEFITDEENENILITPGNFEIGGGWKYGKKFYKWTIPENYILKHNDLIVAMTDLSESGDILGYPALIPNNPNKKFLHCQRIGLVITKNKTNNFFLYYLMKWKEYQKFIVNTATGSTVRHTSPTKILEFKFFLPPLPEQKAIASVLSSFDDKIELLREQNKTLEEIGKVIFQEWFGKYKVGDELPEGWRVGKLGEVVDLQGGFAFKSSDFIEDGKYRLVTIVNVQDGLFVEQTKDALDKLPQKMPDYCNLKTGDILLSLTGNVGRVCHVIGENYLLNQRVAKLQAKEKQDYGFIYTMFRQKSMIGLLESISAWTAQQNLSPIKTADLEIIIPTREILNEFAKNINPMIDKILENKIQIQSLARTRDTLLPKLIRGELRVRF